MHVDLENIQSQSQRVAIITGANSGLGFHTTTGLASKGLKVIMACRDLDKATKAKKKILEQVPEAQLEIIQLDLASFKSVYAFAKAFQGKYHRLDLLINNAGVMVPPYHKTEDGNELQWQVNYLSHFLLTGLLIDLLRQTEGSRIISLSSKAHENARINFKDLNSEENYSKWKAYGQSKLACILFAKELDHRLRNKDGNVISVAAHPGISNTQLFQYVPGWFQKTIGKLLTPLISHPPEKAVQAILLAALGKQVTGGSYYGPDGFQGLKGAPSEVESASNAQDKSLGRELWEVSEGMVGISYL